MENIKELNISKNNITSIKFLYEMNLDNLEILKAEENRINSIEILPFLKCPKLKEIHLNDNKLCNIESLSKIEDFKALEFLDLSNNCFDQKLESNQKLLEDVQKKIKIFKFNEGDKGKQGNDITDEELEELMK